MRSVLAFSTAIGLFAMASAAAAVPITYGFTGTAISQSGVFVGQGGVVTGEITWDTDMVDADPGPGEDNFQSTIPGNEAFVYAGSVTNGAITASATVVDGPAQLRVGDAPLLDDFNFNVEDDFASLVISLLDGGALDLVGPGSGGLTDTPIDPTTLMLASVTSFNNTVVAFDGMGGVLGELSFSIESFSAPTPVPAPPAALLLMSALIGAGAFARLRGRRPQSDAV